MLNKKTMTRFIHDDGGDMAEKGVVLAVIVLAALFAWQLLGNRIAAWVSSVAGAY
jgi:Flp pilus assembly pilin Flp